MAPHRRRFTEASRATRLRHAGTAVPAPIPSAASPTGAPHSKALAAIANFIEAPASFVTAGFGQL